MAPAKAFLPTPVLNATDFFIGCCIGLLQTSHQFRVEEAVGFLKDLLEKSCMKEILKTTETPVQRLCSALNGMQSQLIISQVVSGDTVQIFSSSLSSYFQ